MQSNDELGVDRQHYIAFPPASDNVKKHIQEAVERGQYVLVHEHKKGEECNMGCHIEHRDSDDES